jgi:hypothetical protein
VWKGTRLEIILADIGTVAQYLSIVQHLEYMWTFLLFVIVASFFLYILTTSYDAVSVSGSKFNVF